MLETPGGGSLPVLDGTRRQIEAWARELGVPKPRHFAKVIDAGGRRPVI